MCFDEGDNKEERCLVLWDTVNSSLSKEKIEDFRRRSLFTFNALQKDHANELHFHEPFTLQVKSEQKFIGQRDCNRTKNTLSIFTEKKVLATWKPDTSMEIYAKDWFR